MALKGLERDKAEKAGPKGLDPQKAGHFGLARKGWTQKECGPKRAGASGGWAPKGWTLRKNVALKGLEPGLRRLAPKGLDPPKAGPIGWNIKRQDTSM